MNVNAKHGIHGARHNDFACVLGKVFAVAVLFPAAQDYLHGLLVHHRVGPCRHVHMVPARVELENMQNTRLNHTLPCMIRAQPTLKVQSRVMACFPRLCANCVGGSLQSTVVYPRPLAILLGPSN